MQILFGVSHQCAGRRTWAAWCANPNLTRFATGHLAARRSLGQDSRRLPSSCRPVHQVVCIFPPSMSLTAPSILWPAHLKCAGQLLDMPTSSDDTQGCTGRLRRGPTLLAPKAVSPSSPQRLAACMLATFPVHPLSASTASAPRALHRHLPFTFVALPTHHCPPTHYRRP